MLAMPRFTRAITDIWRFKIGIPYLMSYLPARTQYDLVLEYHSIDGI